MRAAAVVLVGLVACGDNAEPPEECIPASPTLPTTGLFVDPYALELPDDCVEGGLRDLPGRWFVRAPDQFFAFEYPKYEGSCVSGFTRFGTEDDYDDTDRNMATRYTWSDGTRYFERQRILYSFGGRSYEYIRGTLACMRPDNTLAVRYVRYSDEDGEVTDRQYSATGVRFAPKDDVAVGLEYVGEIGGATGTDIYGLNLIVEGDIAYVVGQYGLDTIDVSDPANPVRLGHVDGYLNDVRIAHGLGKTVAFAASEAGDDRVWVIDVTDPTMPEQVSVIDEYAHSLQIRTVGPTTELYLANYSGTVPRYDVTDPLTPVPMGISVLPGQTITGIHDLTVYGDKIYANNTDAGLVAVDTSASFTAPTEIGRKQSAYSHASWAANINGKELVLHGDEGMTTDGNGAAFMRVLDGDPASPTYMQDLGRYQSRPEVGIHNIEVHGTRAYISYYQDGIRIVDLGDPTNPIEVAHYNTWDPETSYGSAFEGAVGVRKVGDYVYVADLARGLVILRELGAQ
jgi:hypothetical protein